jgi:hypothetical protein
MMLCHDDRVMLTIVVMMMAMMTVMISKSFYLYH